MKAITGQWTIRTVAATLRTGLEQPPQEPASILKYQEGLLQTFI